MGTTYTIKSFGTNADAIRKTAETELGRVNQLMSTYLKDSELSRFNAHHGDRAFPVSAETIEVVREAHHISQATTGAFDITIGPLVDAWGFGPEGNHETEPSAAVLETLRTTTGWRRVKLDQQARTLTKTAPEVRCDLSAIAKGYAVDRLSEALSAIGASDHMVEVGGEVRTQGVNAAGTPWRIGVERPTPGGRTIHRVIALRNQAMATSGDYRNYREVAGERISHIIDPRSGRPIRHRLASATVIDNRCMRADGFATALMVLGEEEGFNVASRENLAALLLVRAQEGGFEEKATPRFQEMFP
ncbi:MAG: FAD:protein FMN transferase [bacterium]|nr:FAD:protein FMN transferase [bacterium]